MNAINKKDISKIHSQEYVRLMQKINSEQQEIIDHIEGSLLVLAPAGTGKTNTLTARVANAISNKIPADKILCVTFTTDIPLVKEVRNNYNEAIGISAIKIHSILNNANLLRIIYF